MTVLEAEEEEKYYAEIFVSGDKNWKGNGKGGRNGRNDRGKGKWGGRK
jgi:hypothetical protein